ncbi:MAG: hypothetical protein ACRDD7_04500 [Peptostreptococcaceae bacterium]
MKLNSKLPIIVIGLTIGIFTFICSADDDVPKLNTIRGDINELNDIDIKIKSDPNNNYINYEYDIKKEDTHKNTSLNKEPLSYKMKYTELLDVTNKENLIAHVGYEVNYSGNKNKISLVIDKYKDEKYKIDLVDFDNANENNYIRVEDANKKKINRIKSDINVPVKLSNAHIRTFDSMLYKNEIYLTNYHYSSDYNNMEGIVEISKLDDKNNKIEVIKSINLYEEIKNHSRVDALFTHQKNNNIYIVIGGNKEGEIYNEEIRTLYVLNYDISENNYKIEEIDPPKDSYILHTKLYNDELNITLGKNGADIEVVNFDYDLNTKEIKNEFNVLVEKSLGNINEINNRTISYNISDENKIYLVISDRAYYTYGHPKIDNSVYVIDKKDKKISYEGEINKQLLRNYQVKLENIKNRS